MKRIGILLAIIFSVLFSGYANDVRITQVDTTDLVTSGRIHLYVSVTDNAGTPISGLGMDDFQVSELSGDAEHAIQISRVEEQVNQEATVNFLLLLDNSGSMYYARGGIEPATDSEMKVFQARQAVSNFLSDIESSNDRVGLAAFNTFYTQLSPIIGSTEHAANALSLIQEPNDQEKYTDLFAALLAAGSEMQDQQGRRVIIALSDGVNETYSQSTGEEHPEYGNREFSPQQVSRAYIEEGTTLYAIHFGVIQEAELHTIVENTGGRVYEAENANQLLGVYDSIREQVTSEYRITYTPAPAAADSVEVTVRARRTQGSRVYFAPLMFGPAGGLPIWLLAIVFAAALIIWILLMALKFEKKIKNPSLNVLPTPGTVVSAQTIDLSSGKTVIGGKENCDLTISGTEPVSAEAATILFDEKLNAYTIQGDANVNNRPVKRRKLTDGDVISVGGTVIVFDEPEKPEKETEK